MATLSKAETAAEAIKMRIAPALDTLDATMRQGQRAVVRGQYAAEDAAAAATLIVRRRPLGAVMVAASAGALAGGLIGFGFGWLTRCRK